MLTPLTQAGPSIRAAIATALATTLVVTGATIGTSVANAGPGSADGAPQSTVGDGLRGRLLDDKPLRTITSADLRTELAAEGFVGAASVKYGISTYQLTYATVDWRGRPTVATGLLALPERKAGRRLATVSYTHGTELAKAYAPSVSTDLWATGPAHAYAASGFAAVAPDYLGLGDGDGQHPYLHIPSETTATIDMLHAARAFAQLNDRVLLPDLYITGFSQGASAATGLAKALHRGADRSFRVVAVAPISGVYSMRAVELPALLSGGDIPHPKLSVGYTAYLLTSWNRMLGLYRDSSEVFQPPYDDGRIERVLDGTHEAPEILATIPDNVRQLYTPHAFEMMRHPTGRFAKALREHDSSCSDWSPRVPLRLLYGSGDNEVLNANTTYCERKFAASGAAVKTIDLGATVGHLDSNRVGTAATVRWFSWLAE